MADMQPSDAPLGQQDQVRDQDKVMLVLSYLGLLALIPLLTVKDSPYVKWHARQGITLLGFYIAWIVATVIIAFIPVVRIVLVPLGIIMPLAFLVLCILGIVKAFGGQRWKIPVVGDVAEKISI